MESTYFCSFLTDARLPWWLRRKRICLQYGRLGFDLWVGKIPWRRKWQPTSVFLPGEFHGQRILGGYSLWGHKEAHTTEWLTLPFFTVIFGIHLLLPLPDTGLLHISSSLHSSRSQPFSIHAGRGFFKGYFRMRVSLQWSPTVLVWRSKPAAWTWQVLLSGHSAPRPTPAFLTIFQTQGPPHPPQPG